MAAQGQGGEFGVGDFDAGRIEALVILAEDSQPGLGGQGGQFPFLQPVAIAVGSAGAGGDHQRGGLGVAVAAHGLAQRRMALTANAPVS